MRVEKLFEGNTEWAQSVAMNWMRSRGIWEQDRADYLNAALIGLWQAAMRWKSRMASFKTFARCRINGALLDEAREISIATRGEYERGTRMLRYENEFANDKDDRGIIAGVQAPHSDPADILSLREDARIALALVPVESHQRDVVRMRYIEGCTLIDISARISLSESRCSQICSKAVGSALRAQRIIEVNTLCAQRIAHLQTAAGC